VASQDQLPANQRPLAQLTLEPEVVPHKAGLTFHDLRHTCATALIAAGAHAKVVQERLGHASITTTLNQYVYVLPSTEAALVREMDKIYVTAYGGQR